MLRLEERRTYSSCSFSSLAKMLTLLWQYSLKRNLKLFLFKSQRDLVYSSHAHTFSICLLSQVSFSFLLSSLPLPLLSLSLLYFFLCHICLNILLLFFHLSMAIYLKYSFSFLLYFVLCVFIIYSLSTYLSLFLSYYPNFHYYLSIFSLSFSCHLFVFSLYFCIFLSMCLFFVFLLSYHCILLCLCQFLFFYVANISSLFPSMPFICCLLCSSFLLS
jgi:hypothetical protein